MALSRAGLPRFARNDRMAAGMTRWRSQLQDKRGGFGCLFFVVTVGVKKTFPDWTLAYDIIY
jgi:hypothetical protein